MIRPTTIPQLLEELQVRQAIAREALRLAFIQHRELAVGLKGVQTERTLSDVFDQNDEGDSLVQMMDLDLLVGSGGVLSHAPGRAQSAAMLIDAFQPEGITQLAVDSIFMMPHLGVLSTVNERAATEVFKRDCLIYLGTCVAPKGKGRPGEACMNFSLDLPSGKEEGVLRVGDMHLFPLGDEEEANFVGSSAIGIWVTVGQGDIYGSWRRRWSSYRRTRPAIQIAEDRDERLAQITVAKNAEALRRRLIMAHAYTPGLRVTPYAVVRKDRKLPLQGEVIAAVGDFVTRDQVIARTDLPGDVVALNLVNRLGCSPAEVPKYMLYGEGDVVREGELLAQTQPFIKWFKSTVNAPATGVVESISSVTGQVILRKEPRPVEVLAYIDGQIVEIFNGEGVAVETRGAYIQGIFGVGGECWGPLHVAVRAPNEQLSSLGQECAGKIVVVGSLITQDIIERARKLGAIGLVGGGLHDQDLRALLGVEFGGCDNR